MMGPVLVRVIAVATFNLNSAAMPIHPVIEARLSRLTHLSSLKPGSPASHTSHANVCRDEVEKARGLVLQGKEAYYICDFAPTLAPYPLPNKTGGTRQSVQKTGTKPTRECV